MNLNSFLQSLQYPFAEFLLYSILIVIISLILVKVFSFVINKATEKFDIEMTLNYLLKDLLKYSIYIIAFVLILDMAGINISALVVSLGIIGISIGFAARDIISSFVSGMFILADKTVKVGEVIEVDNIKGEVKKLGFRTTTLITSDNLIVTVPNSVLAKNPYINYTFLDEHRIDLEMIIPFNVNINKFKNIFIQRVSNLDWVLENSSPQVLVKEMVDCGIKLKISAWGKDYSKIEDCRLNLANELRKIINEIGE
ncbi:mechanosensitive ion channel family protein [Methanobrevibacter sp. TMH8]|uniref:mechanosensitive ion channel family protein n=1 Tax=Methanobrevibacter sp. TMH8 TaxID=2848611 RepID=UPI001CCB6CB4|nr:mechanosensitive ion channel family protein [Methanobrevibacter sp. TMH8]MBZ9571690.1 mechanosensitive ion channel family protein [Methanobrevibacter sp. TMH8]